MLNCGHNRVSPSNGMWPLFCNEIGLSYDQEERVRTFQKEVISRNDTWLYRHISYGSQHIIQSLHDAILGSFEIVKKRERSVLDVLTDEQKMKFFIWKMKKEKMLLDQSYGENNCSAAQSTGSITSNISDLGKNAATGTGKSSHPSIKSSSDPMHLRAMSGSMLLLDRLTKLTLEGTNTCSNLDGGDGNLQDACTPMETDGLPANLSSLPCSSKIATPTSITAQSLEISKDHHDSANLYILNHKLSSLSKSTLTMAAPMPLNPLVLKRLSRRPSFESLASVNENESSSGKKGGKKNQQGNMTRATSSGSLKRCSSEMSCDENLMLSSMMMKKSASGHSLSSSPAAAAVMAAMTPEAAQMASSHFVSATLGTVRSIIPTMNINTTSTNVTPAPGVKPGVIRNYPKALHHPGCPPQHDQVGATSKSIQTLGNNTIYQKQQHTTPSPQPLYQPSSSTIPFQSQHQQHNQQQFTHSVKQTSHIPFSSTTSSYSQQQQQQQSVTLTNSDIGMYSTYDSPQNDAIPNSIQSSEVQMHSTNTSSASNIQQPYSAATPIGSYSSTNTVPSYGTIKANVQQQHMSNINSEPMTMTTSISAPVMSSKSPVPSPLGLADQANYSVQPNRNMQHQNQVDTSISMMVDDSILQPFDAIGGSFYNVSNEVADDSLFELTEEDWAIGEGAFLDS